MRPKSFSKKIAELFFYLSVSMLFFACVSNEGAEINPVRPLGDYPSNLNQYYSPQQQPNYPPQYQAPIRQPYYYQQPYQYPYNPAPASRSYYNPYSIPPSTQQNPYYDIDQYYVPPTYYRNVEPFNNQGPRSNTPDAFLGSSNKI